MPFGGEVLEQSLAGDVAAARELLQIQTLFHPGGNASWRIRSSSLDHDGNARRRFDAACLKEGKPCAGAAVAGHALCCAPARR
jgi:hypothetical protein